MTWRTLAWSLAVAAVLAIVIALATAAQAHEAPTGWTYDGVCCSDKDCHPAHSKVTATAGGWHIGATGETIPYSSYKIKTSKDGDFHRCEYEQDIQGVGKKGETRCLYVPPQGF